jgi:hypothetical protein
MKLVKRLDDTAFEFLKNGSIRVGSLLYYRNIEDESRKDNLEGQPPVHVQGGEESPTVLTADEFNSMSEHVGSVFRINKKDLKFNIKGKGKFIIDSDWNVFVFCCSIDAPDQEELHEKFGKNKIEIHDPKMFSHLIALSLNKHVIDGEAVKLQGQADSISHGHRSIIYKDKSALTPQDVENNSNRGVFNLSEAFVKDVEFEAENEYRFVWFPYDNPSKTMCNLPYGFKYIDLKIPEIWGAIRVLT